MGFEVFDYRTDIRNLLVTPQIRSRFLYLEVGRSTESHTHDLGPEIFLVLQGRAEFEIAGHKAVVGPGQLCVALTDEAHSVRNVGDEPVILYLSVTPHIQPTHTFWNDDGTKKPPRFVVNSGYDVEPDRATPIAALADRHLEASEGVAEAAIAASEAQGRRVADLKRAIEAGDEAAALRARDGMWGALVPVFRQVHELADAWNELASRTADDDYAGA